MHRFRLSDSIAHRTDLPTHLCVGVLGQCFHVRLGVPRQLRHLVCTALAGRRAASRSTNQIKQISCVKLQVRTPRRSAGAGRTGGGGGVRKCDGRRERWRMPERCMHALNRQERNGAHRVCVSVVKTYTYCINRGLLSADHPEHYRMYDNTNTIQVPCILPTP